MIKVSGFKAREAYEKLIAQKIAEIEKYAIDNKDVILPFLRLQKELQALRGKSSDVLMDIAKQL